MTENKLKSISTDASHQSGNTVLRVSETRESIQISPEIMDDMKSACIHYLNSKPEEIKQIILDIVKEQLTKLDFQKLINIDTDNVQEFIKRITAANPHIKSISCASRTNHFLVNIVHDYSDSVIALDEIEPLLSSIEDAFETTDFDFNVIHISNDAVSSSEK